MKNFHFLPRSSTTAQFRVSHKGVLKSMLKINAEKNNENKWL